MRLVSESPTRPVSMEALGSQFSSGSWRGNPPSARVWGLSPGFPWRLRVFGRNSVDSTVFHGLHGARTATYSHVRGQTDASFRSGFFVLCRRASVDQPDCAITGIGVCHDGRQGRWHGHKADRLSISDGFTLNNDQVAHVCCNPSPPPAPLGFGVRRCWKSGRLRRLHHVAFQLDQNGGTTPYKRLTAIMRDLLETISTHDGH
ncbi:hypothetical protein P170DRAFT_277775 [Aspergillus steynii IBT 23096]|uniref:Uncharacterized protein n=1 Tax=Aspergillus steynii IBT 23096 TaxID=1392250 RepID=A0A2I2FX84_9EURO|nr:uncharacterized protein P170DRAFT_277775 [Aspergillus steynii IBT 23096]PLB45249.1 hypothetical protein P170DRAFT_277775 [Aspergillus steynii IBT 23096]